MLRDATAAGKEVVYTVVTRGAKLGKAIRTDRWRYTRWPGGEELYDLQNDPAERTNLVEAERHSATVETMRAHLTRIEAIAVSQKR